MVICQDPKFVFVHIPKAAGTSVIRGLKQQLGGRAQTNDRNPELKAFLSARWKGDWPNHAPLELIKAYLGADFEQYYRFAFVRNPWDRVVSNYFYNRKQGTQDYDRIGKAVPQWRKNILELDFSDWVATRALGHPQSAKLSQGGKLLTNYVGKTEHAQDDLNQICTALGLQMIELPVTNVSDHLPYREYYDARSRSIVSEHYADDISLFDYQF